MNGWLMDSTVRINKQFDDIHFHNFLQVFCGKKNQSNHNWVIVDGGTISFSDSACARSRYPSTACVCVAIIQSSYYCRATVHRRWKHFQICVGERAFCRAMSGPERVNGIVQGGPLYLAASTKQGQASSDNCAFAVFRHITLRLKHLTLPPVKTLAVFMSCCFNEWLKIKAGAINFYVQLRQSTTWYGVMGRLESLPFRTGERQRVLNDDSITGVRTCLHRGI